MVRDTVLVRDPLVPVTIMVYDPVAVELIVAVEIPDPLIDVVLSEAVTPVGLVTLSATVEPNPFRRLRLIVEDPCPPVLSERLEGFADRLKPWKVNVAEAVWVRLPLAPVTVSV